MKCELPVSTPGRDLLRLGKSQAHFSLEREGAGSVFTQAARAYGLESADALIARLQTRMTLNLQL